LSNLRVRLFLGLAIVLAAICVRLGFWQLHRLQERRERNALVTARLSDSAVDPMALPRDTASARFRRVRVSGTPDYAHELIYAVRTHNGSPGVNLLTPIRLQNTDTAVLVNRGWIYSPDGATIDESRWHDRDSTFVGYAEELPSTPGSTYANRTTVIARLSHDVVAKALPYPVLPFYVIALDTGDTSNTATRAARLTTPALDEGPHLNYAIQWFGFAAVALIGAGFVVKQQRDDAARGRDGSRRASRDDASGTG
jgi:surfeit locus 1 family protein